jgi:diguanylate cyclase (GGDEF)-like protein/PAS domain S-box-containing protein
LRTFVVSITGLTLGLASFGIGLARLLARRIARPLERLRAAALEIGRGNMDVEVVPGGTAEVDDLAGALDQMRHEIRDSRGELERRAAEMEAANARLQREVEERVRTEHALRESQERYALAARAANDGLWDWDLTTNHVYYSPRWKAMLGLREEELAGGSEEWFSRVHAEDGPRVREELEAHLRGETDAFESVLRMRHAHGALRWMLCRGLAARNEAGAPLRVAGSLSDITERKQAEDQLVHDALHDALTGLPNRALFMDRLAQAVHRNLRRGKRPFALLYLDLDRFKLVNDSLGHQAGDRLLVEVSRRLLSCVRPADTAARLGGDEFAVLLDDIGVADVENAARRIGAELARPIRSDGPPIYTSASIGGCLSGSADTPEQYLRNADLAMYSAKRSGRRLQMFDATMHEATLGRLSLETDLRRAVEAGEFVLHYQPIVSLEGARLEGFEALLRWEHPQQNRISPVEFIPLLEETRLIVPVGAWVVREACRQLAAWQRAHPLAACFVSVNLSNVQLSHPELSQEIEEALASAELQPSCLALEITESTIMENPEAAARTLEGLRALGVRIYLDDFGTGYSSLAYLPRFPIDRLKIDASFVRRMMEHRRDMEVVRAIATVAQSLGMSLVAEGVEQGAQLQRLRELRCDAAQGFLFSPPVEAPAAERLLAEALRRGGLLDWPSA